MRGAGYERGKGNDLDKMFICVSSIQNSYLYIWNKKQLNKRYKNEKAYLIRHKILM